jgi:hypothetical protein
MSSVKLLGKYEGKRGQYYGTSTDFKQAAGLY